MASGISGELSSAGDLLTVVLESLHPGDHTYQRLIHLNRLNLDPSWQQSTRCETLQHQRQPRHPSEYEILEIPSIQTSQSKSALQKDSPAPPPLLLWSGPCNLQLNVLCIHFPNQATISRASHDSRRYRQTVRITSRLESMIVNTPKYSLPLRSLARGASATSRLEQNYNWPLMSCRVDARQKAKDQLNISLGGIDTNQDGLQP